MKFWRHLVVVAFAVAVVVGLGVAWEHSSAAGWITPPGPPSAGQLPAGPPPGGPGGKVISLPPGGHLRPGAGEPAGAPVVHVRGSGGGGMWFDLSDAGNLISTVEIMAAVMAGVVVLEISRRRWRRARRATATRAGPG